ncbi:MAG: MmcB family DNA repair protein, partial [Alphaproteobacteria bacterium]|nr:MmcB family DNA repair protein [Alphaproteobacteria bacterium]
KTSVADLKADQKWPDYMEFCDQLYFATPREFPLDLLPDACGILVADRWGGDEIRAADVSPLHASRRRVLTLKFARKAAQRLFDLTDPALT